jgi:hypothetical protein
MRFAGYVTCIRKMRNVYNVLVRKPEGRMNTECFDLYRLKENIQLVLNRLCVEILSGCIWLIKETSDMLL